MLSWFEKRAPIRVKFKTLAIFHAAIGAAGAGALYWSATHAAVVDPLLLAGIAAAATLGHVLLTMGASRLICTPYVNTVLRMEALADGDLTTPIHYTENTDCVGRMTKAMAVFRRSTEEASSAAEQRDMATALGHGLERLAQGDLSYRIETAFPADFETLRNDYNRAMGAMMEAVRSVSTAAHGVSAGASNIGQASDDLSRRTEQQAASLEETAAAMDEITATVRKTSEGASRANGVVGEARLEAEQSGEVVQRAVAAMSGIERSSSEISEIISVIDGIAFQTNLLALNAGVEAARAGDAGKGFAVVASEVRALAQRSAEAAKDVKVRILASSQQVDTGVELVGETGKALGRIITRIGEISGLVSVIATSAEQQATGLQQVNTAVAEMDGVTQQNAALVEETNAAARSLSNEADTLTESVSRFKIERRAPRDEPRAKPVVHQLQDRVRTATRTAPVLRSRGNAAVKPEDDWSAF
jgi:methyl-accepting chemotaxis protein